MIVEVKEIATTTGYQLVASCDLVVAADNATFATSGVNIGLFCSTPMVALSIPIAHKHAMGMLLLAVFPPAARDAGLRLIYRVVPAKDLQTASLEMARIIADKSPSTVKIGKRAFYEQAEMSLENAYAFAGKTMVANTMARDAEAGIGAFIRKEVMPDWTGD